MNYFKIFKNSLLHPREFFKKPTRFSLKQSLVYFSINFCFYNLAAFFYNSAGQIKLSTPFLITNQMLFILPLTLIGVLLLTVVFHLGAKMLRGDGLFVDSFRAVVLSSPLLIFSVLPIIGMLAYFYQLYLLILAFKAFHHLPFIKSALVIIIPMLFLEIILIALNFSSVAIS